MKDITSIEMWKISNRTLSSEHHFRFLILVRQGDSSSYFQSKLLPKRVNNFQCEGLENKNVGNALPFSTRNGFMVWSTFYVSFLESLHIYRWYL